MKMGGEIVTLAGLTGVLLLKEKDWPELKKRIYPGDVICVERWGSLYRHYGVYVGNKKVVHYAGRAGDWDNDIAVREVSMKEFLQDAKTYMICKFPQQSSLPNYHLYSNKETVKRAYSRLGEREYDLFTNNCEHFAVWCRTNISVSLQAEDAANIFEKLTDVIMKIFD